MVDKDYKDCKHRRLCKTAKKGKWFDCQIAGKGCNCNSTKEWCKYEPYKSVVLVEYNPPQEEPTNWELMSNEQSMEIEHLQEQLQANKEQIKRMQEGLRHMFSVEQENTALKQQLDICVEALEKITQAVWSNNNADEAYGIAKTALDKVKD